MAKKRSKKVGKRSGRRKPMPRVGDVVGITFLDHVEGADEVARCRAFGQVMKVTQVSYTIDSWQQLDKHDREEERHNTTNYTILRGVIEDVVIYASNIDGK